MSSVEEKQAQRHLYLQRLYEKGAVELHPYAILEIGRELGWDDSVTDEVENFLEADRLIKYPDFGQICITHLGQKNIEKRLLEARGSSGMDSNSANSNLELDLSVNKIESSAIQSHPKAIPILLLILGSLIAIVSNVASNVLPQFIKPYFWLSWPLLKILVGISIYLVIKQ